LPGGYKKRGKRHPVLAAAGVKKGRGDMDKKKPACDPK